MKRLALIGTEAAFAKFKDDFEGLQKNSEDKLQEIVKKIISHEIAVRKFHAESLKMRKERNELGVEIFHLNNRLTSETKEAEHLHDELETLSSDADKVNAKKVDYTKKGSLSKDLLIASLNNLLLLDPSHSTFVSNQINLISQNKFDKKDFFNKIKSVEL
jgi:seryl-tRNA synthetase